MTLTWKKYEDITSGTIRVNLKEGTQGSIDVVHLAGYSMIYFDSMLTPFHVEYLSTVDFGLRQYLDDAIGQLTCCRKN